MAEGLVTLSEEEKQDLLQQHLGITPDAENEDELDEIPTLQESDPITLIDRGGLFTPTTVEQTDLLNTNHGAVHNSPRVEVVDDSIASTVSTSLAGPAIDNPVIKQEASKIIAEADTTIFEDVDQFFNEVGDIVESVVDELADANVGEAIGLGIASGVLSLAEFGDGADGKIREFFGQDPLADDEMTQRERAESYIRMAASHMQAAEDADNYETNNIAESIFFHTSRLVAVMPALIITKNPKVLIGVATAADLAIFSAEEPRIANMFAEDLEGPLRDILLHDPADPHYINKMRQAFESFLVNATVIGAGSIAKRVIGDISTILDRRRLAAAGERGAEKAHLKTYKPPALVDTDVKFAMTLEQRGVANIKIAKLMSDVANTTKTVDEAAMELNVHLAMRGVSGTDREAIVNLATRRFKAADKTEGAAARAHTTRPGDARKPEALYDASVVRAGELLKATPKQVFDFLERAMTDVAGPVKRALRNLGEKGEKVAQNFEVMAGATAFAKNTSHRYKKAIYGGLHRGERAELDKLLMYSNMTMLIGKLKPVHTATAIELRAGITDAEKALLKAMTKSEREMTQLDVEAAIAKVYERLGPERARVVQQRQRVFEGAMKTELRKLHSAGLISDAELAKLEPFQHTPMRLLERGDEGIDPLLHYKQGGKTLTVTSSGLKPITSGLKALIHADSQLIMDQVVTRVAGRLARNKANASLYQLAKSLDTNDLVSLTKIPGMTQTKVSAMVKGKKVEFYLDSEYAGQWIAADLKGAAEFKAVLSVISGAGLMRMMATGVNPAFALVQIPRDLQYAWMTSQAWSVSPPKAIVEMGSDIKTIISDAVMRRGRYTDYVEEGGMFSFAMRHGASPSETGIFSAMAEHGLGTVALTRGARKTKQGIDATTDVLGYLGATSEIMTRLAVRERVIQKLMKAEGLIYDPKVKPPKHISEVATAEARALIDFSQGGWLVKGVDSVAPYLNVSVLALRNVIRSGIKNPRRLGAAVTGIWVGSASVYLYNRNVHPECWKQITDRDKANNFIFCTGATVQQEGETRHVYTTIPKDPTVRVLSSVIEGLLGKWFDDENPNDQFFEAVKGMGSLFGDAWGLLPPTLRTYLEYTQNKSFFTDKKLWHGDAMHEPAGEINIRPSRPTSPMAIDVAQALGTSPARLEGSIDSLIPRNPYRDAVVAAYTAATRGEATYDFTEAQRQGEFPLYVAASPIAKSFFKLGYPGANILADVPDIVGPEKDKIQIANREVDALVFDTLNPPKGKSAGPAKRVLRDYLQAIEDPVVRKRLGERAEATILLEREFKRLIGKPGSSKQRRKDAIPPKRWWLSLIGQPPSARAKLYVTEFNAINDAAARRLMNRLNIRLNANSETYHWYIRKEFAAAKASHKKKHTTRDLEPGQARFEFRGGQSVIVPFEPKGDRQ